MRRPTKAHQRGRAELAAGESQDIASEEGKQLVGLSFTPNPAANRFLIQNPFAFLLAVIFDQGILAERAWAAPYELQRRLGHLDPARMVNEPDQVADAIRQPPMLQRFINTIPR